MNTKSSPGCGGTRSAQFIGVAQYRSGPAPVHVLSAAPAPNGSNMPKISTDPRMDN